MTFYQITIQEHLDESWSEWFEGLAITHQPEETTLSGEVQDQVSLFSILLKIRDLNLTLTAVTRIKKGALS